MGYEVHNFLNTSKISITFTVHINNMCSKKNLELKLIPKGTDAEAQEYSSEIV